jgi:hypothetical protein
MARQEKMSGEIHGRKKNLVDEGKRKNIRCKNN